MSLPTCSRQRRKMTKLKRAGVVLGREAEGRKPRKGRKKMKAKARRRRRERHLPHRAAAPSQAVRSQTVLRLSRRHIMDFLKSLPAG